MTFVTDESDVSLWKCVFLNVALLGHCNNNFRKGFECPEKYRSSEMAFVDILDLNDLGIDWFPNVPRSWDLCAKHISFFVLKFVLSGDYFKMF